MTIMPRDIILIAYIISMSVALLLLLSSFRQQAWARLGFVLLFGWSAAYNMITVRHTPSVYLDFRFYSYFPFYKQFIQGFFATNEVLIVSLIAIVQFVIMLSMFGFGRFYKFGCLAGIIFMLGIAPLGAGSAFPSTVIMAIALWLMYRQGSETFLWHEFGRKIEKLKMAGQSHEED